MSDFEPLDVITMSQEDETWPAMIVLLRDFRTRPGWICINTRDGQVERVYDFIDHQYRKIGRVGGRFDGVTNSGWSTPKFQQLLARAVW